LIVPHSLLKDCPRKLVLCTDLNFVLSVKQRGLIDRHPLSGLNVRSQNLFLAETP
jgi:hypothetical protein